MLFAMSEQHRIEAWATLPVAAQRCGLSVRSLRRLVARGELRVSRVTSRVLVDLESLAELLERHATGGKSAEETR